MVGAIVDNELTTAEDWLYKIEREWSAANLYYGHGENNAQQEAYQSVCFVCGLPGDASETELSVEVSRAQAVQLQNLMHQRIETRQPLAYLTNQGWFMCQPFYVDQRVLVPRSPFAEWLARGFSPWLQTDSVENICEIGTGSGCIAVGCAWAFPESQIVAVDISDDALAVARINVRDHHLEDRIKLLSSDVFSAVGDNYPKQKFDLIISNPPYVPEKEWSDLPDEYHFEPKLALTSGDDGFNVVRQILAQAADYLSEDGMLGVEIGNGREALTRLYPGIPFMWLECEFGGDGLFVLSAQECRRHQAEFLQVLKTHGGGN